MWYERMENSCKGINKRKERLIKKIESRTRTNGRRRPTYTPPDVLHTLHTPRRNENTFAIELLVMLHASRAKRAELLDIWSMGLRTDSLPQPRGSPDSSC